MLKKIVISSENQTENFIGYLIPATKPNKLEVEEEFSQFGANILSKS